jgi:hypothetical protein
MFKQTERAIAAFALAPDCQVAGIDLDYVHGTGPSWHQRAA